jgi:hypothetical protein
MIKSVLQSIPSYVMSIFLIPHSLSDKIEKMMNSFWWVINRSNLKGYIGSLRSVWLCTKMRVAWVLKASLLSIMQCLVSKPERYLLSQTI